MTEERPERPSSMNRNPTSGEFSVCQFFHNGHHEYVRRYVSAEEAVRAAVHYTSSPAVALRIVTRVIITDADDYTTFEWKLDEGVVFPQSEHSTPTKVPRI